MKKLFMIVLAFCMIFSLAACGGSSDVVTDVSDIASPGEDVAGDVIMTVPKPKTPVADAESITHLDELQKYGFEFTLLPENERNSYHYNYRFLQGYVDDLFNSASGMYTYGVLDTNGFCILVGDGFVGYEVFTHNNNPVDILQCGFATNTVGEPYTKQNIGYDIEISNTAFRWIVGIAKRYYENPSAPFADFVSEEIAEAAAERNIFIAISRSVVNDSSWVLNFASLDNGKINKEHKDGSKDASVKRFSFVTKSANHEEVEPGVVAPVGFDHASECYAALNAVEGRVEYSEDDYTMKWIFDAVNTQVIIDAMDVITMPY